MVSLYGLKAIFGWEGCFPEEEKKRRLNSTEYAAGESESIDLLVILDGWMTDD